MHFFIAVAYSVLFDWERLKCVFRSINHRLKTSSSHLGFVYKIMVLEVFVECQRFMELGCPIRPGGRKAVDLGVSHYQDRLLMSYEFELVQPVAYIVSCVKL